MTPQFHRLTIADVRRETPDSVSLAFAVPVNLSALRRTRPATTVVRCPRCGSERTRLLSQFGSTACKALYRCRRCAEPFDYFKCH